MWQYLVEKLTVTAGPMTQMIGIARPTDTYKVIQDRLNELGRQGWELVSLSPPAPNACEAEPVVGVFYFKRQVQD